MARVIGCGPRVIHHPRAPEAPMARPIRLTGVIGEWRGIRLLARWCRRHRLLEALPKGERQPVVLIPGWRTSERAMEPLRAFLADIQYDAHHWGFGTNMGNTGREMERMCGVVEQHYLRTRQKVHLIGWSLGGVIARETARQRPDLVASVTTFGSPVFGGPSYTIAAKHWGKQECLRIAQMVTLLDEVQPIQVPITAIYSRDDRIVDWPACIDRVSPDVEHIEIKTTHMTMILDPIVWRVIAKALVRMNRNDDQGS